MSAGNLTDIRLPLRFGAATTHILYSVFCITYGRPILFSGWDFGFANHAKVRKSTDEQRLRYLREDWLYQI
jgi:hypothetical protein